MIVTEEATVMLDVPPPSSLGDCLDAVYGAASDAETWQGVLALFAETFPGTKWAIASEQPKARRNVGFVWHGFDDRVIREYVAHYAAVNPWVPHAAKIPVLRAVASDAYYPSALFKNSEFYAGFIEATGEAESATGIKLYEDADRFAVISCHYGARMADTYNHTLPRFLDAMAPHLRNAVDVNTRLYHSGPTIKTVAALVGKFAAAAFMLDGNGSLHATNEAGEALLDVKFCVAVDREGRLRFADADTDLRLERCLSSTSLAERAQLSAPSCVSDPWRFIDFPFDCPDVPLAWVPGRGRWTIVLFEPLSPQDMGLSQIGARYGLTLKQREIARALVDGLRLSQAADQMGISMNTARQHLKALLAKTGTHRQAELVALLNKDAWKAS